MKRIILLLLGLTVYKSFTFGQILENNNYLYLFSDSIVYGKTIEYKTRFLGSNYFIVDSLKVQPDIVLFYKNEKGFFINTRKLNLWGSSIIAERIKKGKINLYDKDVEGNSTVYFNPYAGVHISIKSLICPTLYYNKGYGELKKVNYKNLIIDLVDNTESMLHLNKFKSLKRAEITFYTIGAALVIGGFASYVNKIKDVDYDNDPHPNLTGNLIFMGAGTVCLIVGATISFGKPKHLKNAIDKFNN